MRTGKHLFLASRQDSRNVDFHGCLHPVETFEFYAEAYHTAARLLFANSSQVRMRRFRFAPIVFLYRHSLELRLKSRTCQLVGPP